VVADTAAQVDLGNCVTDTVLTGVFPGAVVGAPRIRKERERRAG
jgi:hypothetical protein